MILMSGRMYLPIVEEEGICDVFDVAYFTLMCAGVR